MWSGRRPIPEFGTGYSVVLVIVQIGTRIAKLEVRVGVDGGYATFSWNFYSRQGVFTPTRLAFASSATPLSELKTSSTLTEGRAPDENSSSAKK